MSAKNVVRQILIALSTPLFGLGAAEGMVLRRYILGLVLLVTAYVFLLVVHFIDEYK
jgi:hypothetical protein